MWRTLLVVVLATGCQQFLGLDRPHALDASTDAAVTDAAMDASVDSWPDAALSCRDRWLMGFVNFNPPTVVAALQSSSDDRDPTITHNGLAIVFTSNRSGGEGGYDVWESRFDAITGWGAPSPRADLSTTADDLRTTLTYDDLDAVVQSTRAG